MHVGCTYGDFPGSVPARRERPVRVDGAYMLHAYPDRRWAADAGPAQRTGRGTTLTFAIAVNDTVAKQVVSLGPETVVLGKTAEHGDLPDLPAYAGRIGYY